MSPTPSGKGRKKSKRCINEKRSLESCTNKIQMIEPIFEYKIRKRGIACPQPTPPLPPGRGIKVRGVQTKKDVYNRVLTKYK